MPIDVRRFAPFDPRNLHFSPSLLFRRQSDFAAASKVAGLFPGMSAARFGSALFCRVLAGITLFISGVHMHECSIATLTKAHAVEFGRVGWSRRLERNVQVKVVDLKCKNMMIIYFTYKMVMLEMIK